MKFKPKNYQLIAMDFLRTHSHCALFLDMGLGKTVTSLTVAKELIDDYRVEKVLVIAPKRVAEDTWTRECQKWDHLNDLRVSRVLGSKKERLAALEMEADVYVINRENVQWLVEYHNGIWPYDMVIIDELSSFKSPQAKRFKMLRRVIRQCDYVWGLTGTPASNGYMDLWAQIYLIDNGERLGRFIGSYRQEFFYAGAHNGYIVYEYKLRTGAKEKIDRRLSDICLSMSKEDWLEIPPIIFNEVRVRMTKKERKIYDQFERDKVIPLLDSKLVSIDTMDSAVVGESAAVLSGKLLQMANGAVYDDNGDVFWLHDQKLDALDEIVESAQGQPILVFYSYKHDLDRILARHPEAVVLKGSADIERWNKGEIPMLLCHPASAGYGINLQEGSHIMVWFGLPWSLELYQQSLGRLHRQGQEHPVICHHIICEDTLDEKVLRALQSKDATQKSLLDALKRYIKHDD